MEEPDTDITHHKSSSNFRSKRNRSKPAPAKKLRKYSAHSQEGSADLTVPQVGQRAHVLFEGGKKYWGTVSKVSQKSKSKRHPTYKMTICYDDGEYIYSIYSHLLFCLCLSYELSFLLFIGVSEETIFPDPDIRLSPLEEVLNDEELLLSQELLNLHNVLAKNEKSDSEANKQISTASNDQRTSTNPKEGSPKKSCGGSSAACGVMANDPDIKPPSRSPNRRPIQQARQEPEVPHSSSDAVAMQGASATSALHDFSAPAVSNSNSLPFQQHTLTTAQLLTLQQQQQQQQQLQMERLQQIQLMQQHQQHQQQLQRFQQEEMYRQHMMQQEMLQAAQHAQQLQQQQHQQQMHQHQQQLLTAAQLLSSTNPSLASVAYSQARQLDAVDLPQQAHGMFSQLHPNNFGIPANNYHSNHGNLSDPRSVETNWEVLAARLLSGANSQPKTDDRKGLR